MMSTANRQPEYLFSANILARFLTSSYPEDEEGRFGFWADLSDAVGPAMIPFIIRREFIKDVPFKQLGQKAIEVETLRPAPGEMWVLFCFKNLEIPINSPFRSDGFVLILEWRKGFGDSPLLSSAFKNLANRTRRLFEVEGWGLHPSFDRYGDAIDFTDKGMFSDEEDALQIASAWGALAAGLSCCINKKFPGEWSFPSIQWDWTRSRILSVAGLHGKLSVAADMGATTVTLSATQKKEALHELRMLRNKPDGKRFKNIKPYFVKNQDSYAKVSDDIAWGVIRKRRKARLLFFTNIIVLAFFAVLFISQQHRISVERERIKAEQMRSRARTLALVHEISSALEPRETSTFAAFPFETFERLKDVVPDSAEARVLLASQLAKRNWLVPIDIEQETSSETAFHVSSLRSELGRLNNIKNAQMSTKQFWLPPNFPVRYETGGKELVAYDSSTTNLLWVFDFKGNDFSSFDPSTDETSYIMEAWRVNPSGMIGIAEVVVSTNSVYDTAKHLFVAADPFSGYEIWRHDIPSHVTAFAFSNNGERYAYATEEGLIVVEDCAAGSPVTVPKRMGCDVEAIKFSPDDSVLHVLADGIDTSLGIVVQLQAGWEQNKPPDDYRADDSYPTIEESIRILSSLIDPGLLSKSDILSSMEMKGFWGQFMRYSAAKPKERTINLFSDRLVTNYIDHLVKSASEPISSYGKGLLLQPDAIRPLLDAAKYNMQWIARRNAVRLLKCSFTDPRLVDIQYENDSQATWYGEFIFKFILQRDPSNEDANNLLLEYLDRTKKSALSDSVEYDGALCESDEKKRRSWFMLCRFAFDKKRLDDLQKELAFKRAQNDFFHAPRPDDDAEILWNKMLRLLISGTEAGALNCLSAYAQVSVGKDEFGADKEGERGKFVPAVYQYIKELFSLDWRDRRKRGGFVVMGFMPPAESHNVFQIGDIVVSVNGVEGCSVDEFINIRSKADVACDIVFLRYDQVSQSFNTIQTKLQPGGTKIKIRDLKEIKKQ